MGWGLFFFTSQLHEIEYIKQMAYDYTGTCEHHRIRNQTKWAVLHHWIPAHLCQIQSQMFFLVIIFIFDHMPIMPLLHNLTVPSTVTVTEIKTFLFIVVFYTFWLSQTSLYFEHFLISFKQPTFLLGQWSFTLGYCGFCLLSEWLTCF